MFSIRIDSALSLVTIRFAGQPGEAETANYIEAIRTAFVREIGPNSYVMLIDVTGGTPPSEQVTQMFRGHIAGFPRAERIAIVSDGEAARLAMHRLLPRDYARSFGNSAEARTWLLAGWPPPGHAVRWHAIAEALNLELT